MSRVKIKIVDQTELIKMGFQIEEKIKYMGIKMTIANCILFQKNQFETQNEV